MRDFTTISGKRLYELLPGMYREHDNKINDAEQQQLGDLALYLDGCGHLLDLMRNTLEQRLADAFPDNPDTGLACQDWLIPYFGRLLDVHLVSPHVDGQRDEVANAISWRQRKGTLVSIESIVEAITQREGEIQEGWQRVALTPRLGMPLLPAEVFGVERKFNSRAPIALARHPGLPVSTLDLRCPSRAVRTEKLSPATRTSRFVGAPYQWMQANPHGVPTNPEGFDDVSARTVDLRTPDWRHGRYHPKRALIYTPVPMGLFPFENKSLAWSDVTQSPYVTFIYDEENSHIHIRKRTHHPLEITGVITLDQLGVQVEPGKGVEVFTLEGLSFKNSLILGQGRLRLRNVLATRVEVLTVENNVSVLDASDCLFGEVNVPGGYADFERCTMMRDAICNKVDGSNSLFNGNLTRDGGGAPENGRIRYSRIPETLSTDIKNSSSSLLVIEEENCSVEQAVFFQSDYGNETTTELSPDAAVLSPDTPASICLGAIDGGEMGAYHDGRTGRPVSIELAQTINLTQQHNYSLEDLVFTQGLSVNSGEQQPLRLRGVAINTLIVDSDPITDQALQMVPVLAAMDCLFENLTLSQGLARLEYCTVFVATQYQAIQASDCIFNGELNGAGVDGAPTTQDCIRYSRIPVLRLEAETVQAESRFPFCSSHPVIFFHQDFELAYQGKPGCGVLTPATLKAIRFGAEDGGEMGAYHNWRFCLQDEAVIDKLKDYLPVGIEPVLIHDAHMHIPPR